MLSNFHSVIKSDTVFMIVTIYMYVCQKIPIFFWPSKVRVITVFFKTLPNQSLVRFKLTFVGCVHTAHGEILTNFMKLIIFFLVLTLNCIPTYNVNLLSNYYYESK